MKLMYYMDKNKKIYEIVREKTEHGYYLYNVQKLIGFTRRPEIADYTLNDEMMQSMGMQELTPEKQEVVKMLYGAG